MTLAAMALALAFGEAAAAQETPGDTEMRDIHATLLGLTQDGAMPERDAGGDVYYSIMDNPAAPRLVTRLEVSNAPCRARTTSALQFPGQWATLTLGLVDLGRVETVAAYASVDDMIAGVDALPFNSPKVEQIVLSGKGLYCTSRMALTDDSDTSEACPDRLDLSMMDAEQKARGKRALAILATVCKAPAFQKR